MAMAAVSSDEKLLSLRDLLVIDTIALQKWGQVVDHIANQPGDLLRIKKMLKDGEYEEAVLQTLQAWWHRGRQRPDLAGVLEGQGLDALAAKLQESEYRLLVQEIGAECKSGTAACWFEVGQVVDNFTGRQYETEALHTKLDKSHSHKSIVIITISGLGGIGKSTLARNYAFTYEDFYDGNVAWINAVTIESMRASFIRLAKGLGLQLSDQPPQELLLEKVFDYFNDKKCLFIYDNVENLAEFKQFQPNSVNPSGQVPYVLVTSRRTDFNSLPANEIRLDVLKIEDAVKLIRTKLPKSPENDARNLAKKLQRLPLALQQALACIRDKYIDEDKSIPKYLKEFDMSQEPLLKDERFRHHDDYSSTTFGTWQITLARIKETKDGLFAIKVINALAYLNPDLISTEFLKLVFEKSRVGLKLLERFSMVHLGEGKVAIHRLVQHVLRLSLSKQEEEEQLQALVAAIVGEFDKKKLNELSRECMSHGLHFFPFQMKHTHYRLIMANCEYFLDLFYYLIEYGNYAEALSISQQMASLYESVHGEKRWSTIRMKSRMAEAYFFLDKLADSVQILKSILPTAKSVFGTESALTMNIQSRLADCLIESGDILTAVQMYEEIIPIAECKYGDNHNVLRYKSSKAIGLRRFGKLDESLELLQYVHEKRVLMQGENDARTLSTKSQIARIHYDKKEFTKALEIWEEVQAGLRHVLGDVHTDTIMVRNSIAACKAKLSQRANRISHCYIV